MFYNLNIHCPLYCTPCKMYNLYSVQCTPCTPAVQCTFCTLAVQCTLVHQLYCAHLVQSYIVKCTPLYTCSCTVYTLYISCTVYTLYISCAVYTLYTSCKTCTVYSVHHEHPVQFTSYTPCTVYTLYTMYS